MRIAIVTWSRRKVGGVESYLDCVVPELKRRGHDVALWVEIDRPEEREPIYTPEGTPVWCVEELGSEKALDRLKEWRPDVIYAHGLRNADLEEEIPQLAPSILFAHQYHGTCVGGAKTWKFPSVRPCSRRFGLLCFLHYYPHRCGGWHPGTMVREYQNQSNRLKALHRYRKIVTHSTHMRLEYLNHQFSPDKVCRLPFPVETSTATPAKENSGNRNPDSPWNLLFLGRMDPLKGGTILFEALNSAARKLSRPLHLILAGDGPVRTKWEKEATHRLSTSSRASFEFVGWVSECDRDSQFQNADLIVMPSLWPEPFGMVGIEAGAFSKPTVAFSVGGIPDWLTDGNNGCLAPGDPPTSDGFADAIVRCLEDPKRYEILCRGALKTSKTYALEAHVNPLLNLFGETLDAR